MYCDYSFKQLYRQNGITEDGHEVASIVYALSWRYPGTMGMVTTRTRLTIVTNFADNAQPNIAGVSIELWKDSGWIVLEEYFDDALQVECGCVEDIEAKCLTLLEAFFVGSVPEVSAIKKSPGTPPRTPRSPKKPTLKKRTIKRKMPTNAAEGEEEVIKVEEEPDFDWI